MIRFLLRLLAMAALAVAVIMGVLDATRSVAASAPVMTPLAESWRAVSPETLDALSAAVQANLYPAIWDPGMLWVLSLPGFAVFAALAFLLFAAGHRPARPAGRFSVRA